MEQFIVLKDRSPASDVVKAFVENVANIHRLPKEVISEHGAKFTREISTVLGRLLNIPSS